MKIYNEVISMLENAYSILEKTTSLIIKQEVEMLQMISEGGPFALMLVLTAIVCFVYIGLSIKYLVGFKSENYSIAEFSINNIVRVGLFGAALGMLATLMGGYQAISAIREAADVSMYIVYGGINAALSTTILGLQLLVFSAIVWLILKSILITMNKES